MKKGMALPTELLLTVVISVLIFIAGISILHMLAKPWPEKITPLPEPPTESPRQNITPENQGLEPKSISKPEVQEKLDCIQNYSCDFYFMLVPVGNWTNQKVFEAMATERAKFFIDISPFKFKETGVLFIPLEFAQKCNLHTIHSKIARDHLKIKLCADKYADALGIDYERALGIANEYGGGRAFFNSKSVYMTLGFITASGAQETPSLAAHELGHTYNLCDEYSQTVYTAQNHYLQRNTCKNKFPPECKNIKNCNGNTPTYRDYSKEDVFNVCWGEMHYSVMGPSSGSECGYDTTGGYEAIGEGK